MTLAQQAVFSFPVEEAGLHQCLTENFRNNRPAARFAASGVRLADKSAALHADLCTALRSLLPPPAVLPSLTQRATLVGLITRRSWTTAIKKDHSQHPCRMPSVVLGLFPGLNKCPPDTCLPCLSARQDSNLRPPGYESAFF